MTIPTDTPRLKGLRDPREIIACAVWAYHRAHKGLNNAVAASHLPTRKQEKIFGRFKSHPKAQRFLSAHVQTNLNFRHRRYQLTAPSYPAPALMPLASGPNTPQK